MTKLYRFRTTLLAAGAVWCLMLTANALERKSRPLQTGWHEELSAKSTSNWTWPQTDGRADLSAPSANSMRVTLGENSTKAVTNKDTWYWATCSRFVTVDLDKYPILAVRVLNLKGQGRTWWDVFVNDFKGGVRHGSDICGRLGPGIKPGLLMFDATNGGKLTGNRQVQVRLNIAGMNHGAYADYAYVRFIRRQDVKRLKKYPGLRGVLP